MKKFFLMMVIAVLASTIAAEAQTVPFAYNQTIEWSKLDSNMQKTLLSYANAGAYDAPVTIKADSLMQTTLVKGVKSRSGKIEDQAWMQVIVGKKVTNYLFSLSSLPVITGKCCKLTITAHRGDSDELN
ncbi:MAG: hypothetical protein WAZ12_04355 [Candidatus Absconditicoccaceae bacterium]